jgi:hypothetical protein
MARARTGVAVALAAAGVAAAAGPAFAVAPDLVTLDGVNGAVPGLTVAQAGERWGITLKLGDALPGSDCRTAPIVTGGPSRGYALFLDGRLDAVFLFRGARTGKEVRIGSTLARVRAAYGPRLRSRPDKYTPGAVNLFVTRAKAPHWQLRIDVSPARRVTGIAFGGPAVRLVEGCS